MDFYAFRDMVAARCQELGIAEYELYYETETSTTAEAFQHEINAFSASEGGGLCLRCIVNGSMGYAATQSLDPREAAHLVDQAVDNASILETQEPIFLGEGGQSYAPLNREPYALPTTEQLIETVLAAQEQLYAADPAVVDGCQTEGLSQHSELYLYNSKGLDLHCENDLSGLVSVAVVSNGTEMANDYQVKLGSFQSLDTAALAAKAAAEAKGKLGGEAAPTGQYPVVFDSDAMSDLLATFSGIFSSEAAQKGLSRLAGAEGTVIASPAVTLVDDPFHPDSPMPRSFDAEGTPTRKKNIIERGTLNTLLYNLKTAAKAGKASTGNASKGGYDAPVGISPFSMYLEGGSISEEELLRQAGNGVYIHALGGLHAGANPITGDFSLQSSGFLIENGVKTKAVKSFTVAGNFYQLLRDITAVADNTRLPNAMGPTAFGAPSTLVLGLSIAGK